MFASLEANRGFARGALDRHSAIRKESALTQSSTVSDASRRVVEEEEALLARTLACIANERARQERAFSGDLRSVEALKLLRDEARSASEDDLPGLLHEMGVRQRLIRREPASLPDSSSPYLAHLRVRENGVTKDYLLGHASLIDSPSRVRIVDWRVAPVAQIFYRYREGDEYEEEFPGRLAEGLIEARRIVVIEGGQLLQIIGDGLVLTRNAGGAWMGAEPRALVPGGAGTAARAETLGVGVGFGERVRTKDVTALLDAEQFAAITAPASQPLVVLGSAGSGKTTVALHRLLRIFRGEPEKYPIERTRVLVPEEGLSRLARRLLMPFGVSGDTVETLDGWAVSLVRQVFGDKLPRLSADAPGVVTSLKRHPALYHALRRRCATLSAKATTLRHLRKRLAELLTDSAFLAEVVSEARGTLPHSAITETVRYTMLQLATPASVELRSITDPTRKRAIDGRAVVEGTPDAIAGTMDPEDLPILLFLKAFRDRLGGVEIAHLVLDEAEDISPFELFTLGTLLAEEPSLTLAGDEAQQTATGFSDWPFALETLGVKNASTVRLAVSYRCPRPIAELAQTVLGPLSSEAMRSGGVAREGVPVEYFRFADDSAAYLFVIGKVADLADREPEASIAVVASDAAAARSIFALLSHRHDARLVVKGEFTFEPGIDVTHVDAVKGLEFDYVIVPDASAREYPALDEARHRLHVAVTRAAHQLWLVAGGAPTPLVTFAP